LPFTVNHVDESTFNVLPFPFYLLLLWACRGKLQNGTCFNNDKRIPTANDYERNKCRRRVVVVGNTGCSRRHRTVCKVVIKLLTETPRQRWPIETIKREGKGKEKGREWSGGREGNLKKKKRGGMSKAE
jgi:hypothetical protein